MKEKIEAAASILFINLLEFNFFSESDYILLAKAFLRKAKGFLLNFWYYDEIVISILHNNTRRTMRGRGDGRSGK